MTLERFAAILVMAHGPGEDSHLGRKVHALRERRSCDDDAGAVSPSEQGLGQATLDSNHVAIVRERGGGRIDERMLRAAQFGDDVLPEVVLERGEHTDCREPCAYITRRGSGMIGLVDEHDSLEPGPRGACRE